MTEQTTDRSASPVDPASAPDTPLAAALRAFNVVPSLPPRLERLRDVATNLWWVWEPAARELFVRIDRDAWDEHAHNPVSLLAGVSQERLEELAGDESFLAHLDKVTRKLDYYLEGGGWFAEAHQDFAAGPIGYFSMEFGLHSSVPIYSGGLGVLAGDHLKAASDLGVPLVGIGLLYRNGYFRQYLNSDGWQQERYPTVSPDELPVTLARMPDDTPVRTSVDLGGRRVTIQVWRLMVGRVRLFLLDTDLHENAPEDRALTARLYGGDDVMRVQQEKVLGVGGMRALELLGISPSVCHMNEGHSAFLALEWIRMLMKEHGVSFSVAREAVTAGTVFTTHTPVPAGNDTFDPALIRQHFGEFVDSLGISMDEFVALGQNGHGGARFSMTMLALRLSRCRNGVSRLHGSVSRNMWHDVWRDLPVDEVPIRSITNAVHQRTWLSSDLEELFDRYLDPKWVTSSDEPGIWERVAKIPNTELWYAHERCRERLVGFARARLRRQLIRRGAPPRHLERADDVLDPKALTIGFSRRFATYKRATLLFANPDRLAEILNDPERPVQVVFAGKAHPRDDAGKDFIRRIVHFAREERFHHRILFLEDYEMTLARYLVQGVDVWLNTPRRPLEASGTSGMKAALNGVLNLSVLDGWWAEGYRPELGWAIGSGEEYEDPDYQDKVESEALYDVLEHEIVPEFYDRGKTGLPRTWVERMKACIETLSPEFTMDRMVKEYAERFYVRASASFTSLGADGMSRAAGLSTWRARVAEGWDAVAVGRVEADRDDDLTVGSELRVRAVVELGNLRPEDVTVELYHGRLEAEDQVTEGDTSPMALAGGNGDGGAFLYEGAIPCDESGRHAFAVRVMPMHPDLGPAIDSHLVRWG